MVIFLAILFLLFSLLIWQDFKYRAISWIILLFLFLVLAIKKILFTTFLSWAADTLINLGFLAIQFFVLALYLIIKRKDVVNIFNKYSGLGDWLFFVAISAAFSPPFFIVFITAGLLFSLIAHVVAMAIVKKYDARVPLAGFVSAFSNVLIIIQLINPNTVFFFGNISFAIGF